MSKRIIRTVGLVLALLAGVFQVASCGGAAVDGKPESSAQNTADNETTAVPDNRQQPDRLEIIRDGKTDYVIVRSLAAKDWEISLSKLFCDTVQALTGVAIPIVDDYENAETGETRAEKEIVFGTTNRENEYTQVGQHLICHPSLAAL